ncbi:MAG: penA [Rickettsiaceae bacterium]|jgi:cell division protein FtsI (penicillin-binding protein 3)|nr:penA [Rickettsiaceae bacterium]
MINTLTKGNESGNFISIGKAEPSVIGMSHTRLRFVLCVFIVVYLVLSVRVVYVAVFNNALTTSGYSATTKTEAVAVNPESGSVEPLLKHRAEIIDRNGTLLAVNLATASLYANPKTILDVDEAVKKLTAIFPDMEADKLKQKLSAEKSFVWIKRNLTPDEQYKVNALGLPGLYFKEEEKRVYPHKELVSHILGFVNVDGQGLSGIEKQFNMYLSGTNDIGGVNEPLRLSVDIRVQSIVHDALQRASAEFKTQAASAIVMDVNTGEIVSMVSLPDYDINNPSIASDDSKFNRATLAVYEMGSTFKTFNMALGFELGDIDMKDTFDVSEPIKLGRFSIRDYHQDKSVMTVPEIFIHSSNIGSVKIADKVDPSEQKAFLERLGLLDELDIELPEKSHPLFPSKWTKSSSMTISYGHGIAVTSMHVVKATAALVNGGILNPATLIKKEKFSFIKGERVVSEATSSKIRKLMRWVVKYGTGKKAEVEGYMVGGKTGSAEKVSDGGYDKASNISSFIGTFPSNKPQYVILVMLDAPVGNASTGGFATGGMVAAPVVNDIVKHMAPVVGIMPVDENDAKIKKEFWYEGDKEEE